MKQSKTGIMTYKEEAQEIIKTGTVKDIFDMIRFGENKACAVFELIKKNADGFKKDIAEQGLKSYWSDTVTITDEYGNEQFIPTVRVLSDKQVWCLSYEVFNNKEQYS